MKSMYSLPSSSMRVEPVPRAIASPAMRAKDWLPGATCRRSWATMRCDRGPTSRRSVMVAGAARPEDSVGGLRHGATWLRPSHPPPCQRGGRAPGRLRGWPETRCDLAPSLMALFISQQAGVQEAERQVGGDALRRLVAVEREARPGVHVQQHGRARRRNDHVPAVHLEAERHRRAAHEAREAPLVERMAGQALVLVVEPAEPRRRAVPAPGADA